MTPACSYESFWVLLKGDDSLAKLVSFVLEGGKNVGISHEGAVFFEAT